jgi:hypothetical protein
MLQEARLRGRSGHGTHGRTHHGAGTDSRAPSSRDGPCPADQLRSRDDVPHAVPVRTRDLLQAVVRDRSVHRLPAGVHGAGDQLRAAGGERAANAIPCRLLDQVRADAARIQRAARIRRAGRNRGARHATRPLRSRHESVRRARADDAPGLGSRRGRRPPAVAPGLAEHRGTVAPGRDSAPDLFAADVSAAARVSAADRPPGWNLFTARPDVAAANCATGPHADSLAEADPGTAPLRHQRQHQRPRHGGPVAAPATGPAPVFRAPAGLPSAVEPGDWHRAQRNNQRARYADPARPGPERLDRRLPETARADQPHPGRPHQPL